MAGIRQRNYTLLIIGIFVLAVFVLYLTYQYIWNSNNSGYRAVYLDNGEVYFGKLQAGFLSKYIVLEDVYYFKNSEFIRQNGDINNSSNLGNGNDFTLLKMGSEVHAPENSLKILESHVLFIERLSKNSKVLEAISSRAVLE